MAMSEARPGFFGSLLKLPARIRARGLREVAMLGLQRLRESIRSDDRLIFFVRSSGGTTPSPKSEGLSLQRAESSDAASYARDIGTDSAATFASRLTDGTRCYLVFENAKILHATWVTTSASWVREIGRYFRPPPGEAYVYESFTREDARGKGVYPFALHGISADLALEGVRRVWVAVEDHNAPSLRAVAKGGFEEAFDLSLKRRWGRLTLSEPTGPQAATGSDLFVRKLGPDKSSSR